MSRTFNLLARPSAYDTARALANRDDYLEGYTKVEVPKDMKYPKSTITKTSLYVLIKEILTI